MFTELDDGKGGKNSCFPVKMFPETDPLLCPESV